MEKRSFEAKLQKKEGVFEIPKVQDDLEAPENQDIQTKDRKVSIEKEANVDSAKEISSEGNGIACFQKSNDNPLQPEESVDAVKDVELPSEVIDRDYIYMPRCLETSMSEEVWNKGGKWLWFCHNDIHLLSRTWLKLQRLVEDGTFIGLKASTAKCINGVIVCYTADAEDKKDVKKAAEALRRVTQDNRNMHYKTNEKSMLGKNSNNSKLVAKYKHTVEGKLYEREGLKRWTQVDLTIND